MKKLFFAFAVMCASLQVMANSAQVVQGDKKFFKTASGNASLEIIFDGATYDDKMPLEQHYTNLNELKTVAYNGFCEEFNDRCKTVKVVQNAATKVGQADGIRYKFTLKVTKMDSYLKVMGFIPAPATKMWGTFEITDLTTGEVVLIANINEADGGANPSPDGTFSDCFEDVGKIISKLK